MKILIKLCRNCRSILENGSFCNEDCRFNYQLKEEGRSLEKKKETNKKQERQEKKRRWKRRLKSKKLFDGKVDPFYRSIEWKQARLLIISKFGKKCMACGADCVSVHVDHIKPRSKYPKLSLCLSNLQILCLDCNEGKGAWDETDFRTEEQRKYFLAK